MPHNSAAELIDGEARAAALQPDQSFIVQAPAGSGKTGLLVRRYLCLLGYVKQPEEILAITFTRKATAEMRERILCALEKAARGKEFDEHEKEVEKFARAALKRDQELNWKLLENPSRMRILTIDALSMQLVKSMPWSSRFTAMPNILSTQQCDEVYAQVAQEVLQMGDILGGKNDTNDIDKTAEQVRNFIELVNADIDRATRLFKAILQKRDLWLRGLGEIKADKRDDFERQWRHIVVAQIATTADKMPPNIGERLPALIRYAADNLPPHHALAQLRDLTDIPRAEVDNLTQWRAIVNLLLVQENDPPKARKRVNKTNGFPTPADGGDPTMKNEMQQILQDISENTPLLQALSDLRILPPTQFSERQWQALESILAVIKIGVGKLKVYFSNYTCADFVEINQRAETALIGLENEPTDLALELDYKLSHLLMDEVQDTSKAQIDLVKLLTRGWQADAGKTLFFVGDPMQSIYRFREAEIANFFGIRDFGVGAIQPEFLQLKTNFRSNDSLVQWFNDTFSQVFPAEYDRKNGAVSYAEAVAAPTNPAAPAPENHGVRLMCRSSDNSAACRTAEAQEINLAVKLLQRDNAEKNPKFSIGILGRSRSHLVEIATELRKSGIKFEAVELESLASRPAILDLLALTRGLLNSTDRIAWLAILRAPWCGLQLDDLTALAADFKKTLPALICGKNHDHISADGQQRLAKVADKLTPILSKFGRQNLSWSVQQAWFKLGGAACIQPQDARDCEAYFTLLQTLELENDALTPLVLRVAVDKLWSASSDPASVKIMTIHKSKGLEFDAVFVPSLERKSRNSTTDLLQWARLADEQGAQMLVAPLPHSDEIFDEFNTYLRHLEKTRQLEEDRRLLYVACTRARKHLYLSANISVKSDGEFADPASGSLLHLLWGILGKGFLENREDLPLDDSFADTENTQKAAPHLHRFAPEFNPPEWQSAPISRANISAQTGAQEQNPDIEFSWTGEVLRITGIAIHAMLQKIEAGQWENWKQQPLQNIIGELEPLLKENGLHSDELNNAKETITVAIHNLRDDANADWIFSDKHQEIKNEWALTGLIDGAATQVILDRCFIDKNGSRWIIDYKSSRHKQQDIAAFLDQEVERYRAQLQRYASIVNMLEQRPTRTALYFPLLKAFREIT